MPSDTPSPVLDYGRPDPPLLRWRRRIPRPSLRTLNLALVAVLLSWWFWSVRKPWMLERSIPGGYASLAEKISADGTKLIAAAGLDAGRPRGDPMVWDIRTGRKLFSLIGHEQPMQWASFSQDGTRILSGDLRRSIYLWDGASGKLIQSLGIPSNLSSTYPNPREAYFSPDSRRVVVLGSAMAELYDAMTAQKLAELEKSPGFAYVSDSVAFSSDSKMFCVDVNTGPLHIRSTHDGSEIAQLAAAYSPASPVFSPDDQSLATGNSDTVALYDARTGAKRWETKHFGEIIRTIVFSPHGRRIWVIHDGRTTCNLTVIDASNGSVASTFPLISPSPTQRLLFSPDGRYVLLHSSDGWLELFDAAAPGKLRSSIGAVPGYASPYSPDGSRLALLIDRALLNSTVELFNATASTIMATIFPSEPQQGRFTDACFLGDAKHLVTANDAGNVQFWRLRRPEHFWGIFELPQLWLALVAIVALFWSIYRDLRKQYGSHTMAS